MEMTPGKVHSFDFGSEILNGTYEIQYYLPKNYSDLYKHHVIITFDSQDFFKFGQIERAYEKLAEAEEIERAIIVGIPYPSVDWREHYFNPNGEHHEDLVAFVSRELISWIDKTFPTLKVGTSRLLMGESFAASAALSVAVQYPSTFSQAAAFSPFVDDDFIGKFKAQPALMNLDIYHTIGLEEDDFKTISGHRADFLTPNRRLNEFLEDEPLEYQYHELDGGHIWKTWKPEIDGILKYYLS